MFQPSASRQLSYTDAATGYLKLGARYYNPTTGRFTQPDPAATYGGYAYAGDNPANNIDPSGLSWYDPFDWLSNSGVRGCIVWGGGAAGSTLAYTWWAGEVSWVGAGIMGVGGCASGAVSAYWN